MTQHYDPRSEWDADTIEPPSRELLGETLDIVAHGWDEQRQRAEMLETTAQLNANAAEMWRERAEKALAERDALAVAVIGEQDYVEHPGTDGPPSFDDADQEYQHALRQAAEMHRLLVVRADRLADRRGGAR